MRLIWLRVEILGENRRLGWLSNIISILKLKQICYILANDTKEIYEDVLLVRVLYYKVTSPSLLGNGTGENWENYPNIIFSAFHYHKNTQHAQSMINLITLVWIHKFIVMAPWVNTHSSVTKHWIELINQ